ncbi:MAG: hypothetical protein KC636_39955 [Myxococcales bacterium]|nr:hypothetical protein [Myxococcales bacterium]
MSLPDRRALRGWARERGLVALAVILAGIGLARQWAFVTDDAFITLRYAANLSNGQGIVWNPGEAPVEGYSNFLTLLLSAACLALGGAPIVWLRALGAAATVGLVLLTSAAARRLGAGPFAAGLGSVVLALHAPLAYWAASGLETPLYALLGLSGLLLVARDPALVIRPPAAACLLLAAVARPEGPLFAGIAGIVGLVASWRRGQVKAYVRASLPSVLALAAIYGAYFAWRVSYFGYPLPNSVYYKAGDGARHGGELVWDFLRQNPLVTLLALVAPWSRLGAAGALLGAVVGAHLLLFHEVVPSVAQLHRLLLPALPAAVALAAVAVTRVAAWPRARWRQRVVLVTLWTSLCAWECLGPEIRPQVVASSGGRLATRIDARARVAAMIYQHVEPRASVAIGDVGVVGYAYVGPILDAFGLNSVAFTHEFARARDVYITWLHEQAPDVVVAVSRSVDEFKPRYRTDHYLTEVPGFYERFERVGVAPSARGRYHYFVFVRRDSPRRRATACPAPALDDDPIVVIERLRAAGEAGRCP